VKLLERLLKFNRLLRLPLVILAAGAWSDAAVCQELTPRSFWPAPAGTQVLVAGYAHASGDVLMDPSVPLYGVDSEINSGLLAYMRTFGLRGRTANLLFELPYSGGTTKGFVGETADSADFAGFSDLGASLTVNLVGAPSMTPGDFQALRANPRFQLGLKFKLVLPTGHYEKGRLVRAGKVELGSVIPLMPRWLLELQAGAWFFGADDDFIAGKREQDPIYSAEVHVIRRFKPGFWASLDANYFTGGRQTIGGDPLRDLQSNRRFGGTLVVPFAGRHAIKVGYSIGTRTRYGDDFRKLVVAYQVLLS
jgi:hypothetical protein